MKVDDLRSLERTERHDGEMDVWGVLEGQKAQ